MPRAWQGMKPLSTMGRPQMSASAMVPGPALVTMTLHADIHSAMLLTKPFTSTRMPPGKCLPAHRHVFVRSPLIGLVKCLSGALPG